MQGRFGSDAARAACVGHHPARGLSRREDRELLVADINVEYREIAPHGAVHAREVAAQFVVPAVFGFVGHAPPDVVDLADAHFVHQRLLQHVGEYLGVEAARLISFGHRDVEVADLVEGVHDGEFGQELREVLFQRAAVVDFDGAFVDGPVLDMGFRVAGARVVPVVEAGVLEVEAQPRGEAPAAERVVRFVVDGPSGRGHAEVAAQEKRVASGSVGPAPGVAVGQVVFVGVLDDQLLDARAFEVHRGFHHAVAVESEGAQQPAVAPSVVRTENDVLGQGVFAPGLPEREPGFGREVLVERHLVVGVLVRGDRRDGIFRGVVAHRESVADRCAAVGRRVVIADLAVADDGLAVAHDVLAGVGVGITSLVERREREGVVDAHSPVVAPLRFPASSAQTLPVAFLARAVVVEEAARVGEIARHGHSEVGR